MSFFVLVDYLMNLLSTVKENGGVHRCVVASITVKAPVREVWNILTAYESLPE